MFFATPSTPTRPERTLSQIPHTDSPRGCARCFGSTLPHRTSPLQRPIIRIQHSFASFKTHTYNSVSKVSVKVYKKFLGEVDKKNTEVQGRVFGLLKTVEEQAEQIKKLEEMVKGLEARLEGKGI
ncbi:Protein of unknown function [Pyronema omphalodes CBS 100304]|uniref:Uncharacterized protein n=1 Tax=Pyronema omphalodes (strain CBS 100304) TaxID=1076935 RepID=U4L3B8_PYROM|nr:Protein of unknown function [Pyronema omphalodes CBS 100304]